MSPHEQLAGFVAEFTSQMQEFIAVARDRMHDLFPDAWELVWDNYNFLVIAYSPTDGPEGPPLSLGAYRGGINLFLVVGEGLDDPHGLLRGSGTKVRHVPLATATDLDRPEVRDLIAQAADHGVRPLAAATGPGLVIRGIAGKRRPRR